MDIKSKIEAVLFASGEPLSITRISKILKITKEETKTGLKVLQEDLENNKRGIRLIKKGEEWLLVSAPEMSTIIAKLRKDELEGDLSQVSAETLAIIAYRGPITRAEISAIRGVDSTYTLHNLLLRGLIERFPDPQRKNTYLYNISFSFLQHLGLQSVEKLPQYEQFHLSQ